MATKEEVLQYIKELASKDAIKKEEIIAAFEESAIISVISEKTKSAGISEILYYVGGAVVFIGISIFIWQNWSQLNSLTKILSTLGSSVAAYFMGLFFISKKKTENIALSFYLISALVMPLGLYITFYEVGFDMGGTGMQSLISAILLMVYLLSFAIFRKSLFIVFSVIFSTWFFFSFTSFLVGNNPLFGNDFFQYRILAVGLAYILLGYYFYKNSRSSLTGFLYGFGIMGFLGSALFLGGWQPNQKIFWEIIFPGLVFGTLFLSVFLKSRAFLTFGTIYLMLYIIKITSEYFSGSLGWPLSLVLIGFLLIASGYLFIYIKNKYIRL